MLVILAMVHEAPQITGCDIWKVCYIGSKSRFRTVKAVTNNTFNGISLSSDKIQGM